MMVMHTQTQQRLTGRWLGYLHVIHSSSLEILPTAAVDIEMTNLRSASNDVVGVRSKRSAWWHTIHERHHHRLYDTKGPDNVGKGHYFHCLYVWGRAGLNESKMSHETNYHSILGTRLRNAWYMVARVENAMLNVNDMWRFYKKGSKRRCGCWSTKQWFTLVRGLPYE